MEGPFEHSFALKQCDTIRSFSSRNAMLRSIIGLFSEASIIAPGQEHW